MQSSGTVRRGKAHYLSLFYKSVPLFTQHIKVGEEKFQTSRTNVIDDLLYVRVEMVASRSRRFQPFRSSYVSWDAFHLWSWTFLFCWVSISFV